MPEGGHDDERAAGEPATPAPTVLDGKYRLERLLGEGGMGSVHEARHQLIGRACAVKLLRPEIAHDVQAVQRFLREARAAAAIGHRGIVDVYDVGVSPQGRPYLVMELLRGESLGQRLHGGRRLEAAAAAEILVQVLDALAYAHRAGIVHRDLKPDNLFLVPERGGSESVKILDFGVSRMQRPDVPDEALTRSGMVLGTPHYMAPEQAAGATDIDHRIDLYAVGVILYRCLTGRLPFSGDNYNQLILRIATVPFPRAREVEPSIPEELEAVILRATERERERRYPDADAMLRALLEFVPPKVRSRLGFDTVVPAPPPTAAAQAALDADDPAVAKTVASGAGQVAVLPPAPAEPPARETALSVLPGTAVGRRSWLPAVALASALLLIALLWAVFAPGGRAPAGAADSGVDASAVEVGEPRSPSGAGGR
ncbi:MAG: serine/threonine protein kinase [Deltaproteobacteria bacterium]|nr:serine/threonine protein kinase [Deltaproteobacteria bacterium]